VRRGVLRREEAELLREMWMYQVRVKYSPTLVAPSGAASNEDCPNDSKSSSKKPSDYRKTFFEAYPEFKGRVIVHHSIEQQILTKYPGLFTRQEVDGLWNLRVVPKSINSELYPSQIRLIWNKFYAAYPQATRSEVIEMARWIDQLIGDLYMPRVDYFNPLDLFPKGLRIPSVP